MWWIAGNLMRDAAALDNLELLPWDAWGAKPAPDAALAELWRLCRDDDRLRVPPTVYNALRDRYEAI